MPDANLMQRLQGWDFSGAGTPGGNYSGNVFRKRLRHALILTFSPRRRNSVWAALEDLDGANDIAARGWRWQINTWMSRFFGLGFDATFTALGFLWDEGPGWKLQWKCIQKKIKARPQPDLLPQEKEQRLGGT